MKHCILFIGVILFFLPSTSTGQHLKFYTPQGDISQNTITSIVQDHQGFLWFGTKYGLNRYDGLNFQSFYQKPADENGLPNSSIESLMVDQDNQIWVGTLGSGISIYNVAQESFVPLNPNLQNPLSKGNIVALFEDVDGDIWIGTEKNGLKLWNKKTETLQHFFAEKNEKNSLSSNHIRHIAQDDFGIIWVATWEGGLCSYHKEKKIFTVIDESTSPSINNNIVRQLHKGKEGKMWIGMNGGIQLMEQDAQQQVTINFLELADPTLQKQLDQYTIISILEDAANRLWIGTENNGLLMYDLATKKVQHFLYAPKDKYSIQNNSIWALFEDYQNTVWIGLFKSGINKVDAFEQKFNHISDGFESKLNLSYGLVSSFAEDPQGNLWVGTDGGGLNFIDRSQSEMTIQNFRSDAEGGIKSKEIVCLMHDRKDQLWIGTWGEGVYLKNNNPSNEQAGNTFTSFTHDPNNLNSLAGNNITAMCQDEKNNIWIGNHRIGIDLYVPAEKRFYHLTPSIQKKSISGDKTSSIVADQNGYVWVGTEASGVDRILLNEKKEIAEITNYRNLPEDPKSLSNNLVNYLYVDSKNRIWVATDGGGVNILENVEANSDVPPAANFKKITTQEGLPSNVIYGVLEETPHLFWVSTNAGLASINLATDEIITFDLADGLQAKEFNKNACFKTLDSTFLFGGINGFNYFKPQEISKNEFVPPIYITGVEVQNGVQDEAQREQLKKQFIAKNMVLEANQNDLKIDFAALNYAQASKNKYAFQLENYDSDWRAGKPTNSVTYTNLPPGKYRFKVKAANNDGVWNEQAVTLNLKIKHPWYQSWVAWAAYFLLVSALLFLMFRMLIQRERMRNQLKVEQLESLKMQELNQVRSQFFANISHEFKTPLTLIISPLKAMQQRLEKMENKNQVNVMVRNAERLLRLINQILDLSKLESGIEVLKPARFDIVVFTENIAANFQPYSKEQFVTFELDLPKEPIPLYFEKDKMEKILINLISNAFKYTPEFGTIQLKVSSTETHAIISISDTGIGISSDQVDLIFNRFYQAKNNNKRNGGTGIGLSLTKQLVELHGGKIEVNSEQRQGTQFDVFIPLGNKHLAELPIDDSALPHQLSEDSRIELQEFGTAHAALQNKNAEEDADLPVILIVEDNPDLRAFTRTYLQNDYRILEAENGKQGYELAKRNIPDLIITDLMMPQMNGLELCEKIRNDEKTSHIFIIMLTVRSSEESREMGFEYGADYYLTKPFNPKLLDLRIKNILKAREQYKKQFLQVMTSKQIAKPNKISTKDELFVEKVLEIVETNLENSEFQIEDLCRALGFSKSQLYRKMKGLLGQSANEFIRTIRLKKAAELLQNKTLNIAEITYKVGFNDLQYFRSCFKKQYGVTPSEYAQQFKAQL